MRLLLVLLVVAVAAASAAPWFDIFSYGRSRPRRPQAERQPRGNGYKEICRTINADNYAFPGQQPFPSGPLCPW